MPVIFIIIWMNLSHVKWIKKAHGWNRIIIKNKFILFNPPITYYLLLFKLSKNPFILFLKEPPIGSFKSIYILFLYSEYAVCIFWKVISQVVSVDNELNIILDSYSAFKLLVWAEGKGKNQQNSKLVPGMAFLFSQCYIFHRMGEKALVVACCSLVILFSNARA